MRRSAWILSPLAVLVAAAAICMLPVASASAALLEIEFTGLNLAYDGTDIYDAGGAAEGDSDELTTMTFELDGALLGTLTTDIGIDALIPDVTIPAGGGSTTSTGSGGFFDLLTSAAGIGLALDIESFDIFYTGFDIAIFGNGFATEVAQDLPLGPGIIPGSEVSISFSTQVDVLTDDGSVVTSFESSGTGEVRGAAIPEPGTLLLSLLGSLVGCMMALRYRWG